MPKVSVIVPIYKAEKYINRCIDSILAQTFTDWELLLIDDGSPDRSGEICDEYAENDPRIRVFHKANGGVGSARNLGIEQASGDWIVFVDSDDWCEPNYIANFFIGGVSLTDDDIVIQGRKNECNRRITNTIVLEHAIYKNIADGLLDNNLLTFGAPYCKLYSNHLIQENNIRFPENYSYGEDTTFFFNVLFYTAKMITTDRNCYHYVDSAEISLSKKDHDFEPLKDFLSDSMTLVKAIDAKFNMHGRLVNAYIPNYRNLLLRSIANMYRLEYTNDRLEICFSEIKQELLPLIPEDKNPIILIIRLCPIKILYMIFNIIMKIRR